MNKDKFHNHIGQEIGFTVDDWHVCQLPSRTDMNGRFCRLEALNVDKHAEDLFISFRRIVINIIGLTCLMDHSMIMNLFTYG